MQNKLEKPLGFWMCTSLVVGNIIGMGIFMLPVSLAPFGMNAFLGWGVTVLGCLFIARLFADFARALPQEDGPYGYTRRAFGNGAAFFVMWCYWVSIWAANAAIAIGVVGYLTALLPVLDAMPWLQPLCAMAIIWFFVLINALGARTSGRVQVATTLLKLLPLFGVLLLGLYLLFADAHAFAVHLPATGLSFDATAGASTVSLFAMLGVECATIPAGKVDRPETTIPRATMAGTLIAAAVYVGVSAVVLLLLPQAALAQSNAPFVDLFQRYWSADSGRWLAGFVVVSGLGALNGWTMIAGEVTASFAKHGVFPARFSQVNRFGAPYGALLLAGALASLLVGMNYSRSLAQGFTFLNLIVTAANLPLYLIAGAAMLSLCKRGLAPSTLAVRGAAVLASLFALWASYGMGREALLWALALGALSLPVFYFMRRKKDDDARSPIRHPV